MRIKVLVLTSAPFGFGGVERLLVDSAGLFDAERFDIHYCNLFDEGAPGPFARAVAAKGVSSFSVGGQRGREVPSMVVRLARILRTGGFDILCTQMLHAHIVGAAAAAMARVPIRVVARHYGEIGYHNHGAVVRSLDRMAARTATHAVACSASVGSFLVEADGVPPDRLSVIPNAIDLQAFDRSLASSPEEMRAPDRPWIVGTIGSLTPWKGHAELLKAFAAVRERRQDVRLVIVGEGPERSALEADIEALGLGQSVTLAGFKSDVAATLRNFDLYLHPSKAEAFGISLIEAMAARRCVVATAVDGIPEVVVDGATGVLVPRSNPEQLAEAILGLLRDPERATAMGERGRARVEELYAIPHFVEKFENLYSRLARRLGYSDRGPVPSSPTGPRLRSTRGTTPGG